MKKLNLERVVSKLQEKVNLIQASLHSLEQITPEISRVVVEFTTESGNQIDRRMAIASLFKNELVAIPNSFREISGYRFTATGFVSAKKEEREYTDEVASSGRYKVIANNVMMDTEDESLWSVNSSGDSKYLIRHGEEDLSDLVALASLEQRTRTGRVINVASIVSPPIQAGEYVSYVNPNTMEVAHGYAVGYETVLATNEDGEEEEFEELQILDKEANDIINIDPHLVVESAVMNGDDKENMPEEVLATMDEYSNSVEGMKEYYKKMFEYNPAYYEMMSQIIDGHAVA